MTYNSRDLWIDSVKGLTIMLVVFHHVFQGVQTSIGFSDLTIEIYRLTSPIRMPLFFLVAGFFAKKSIDGSVKNFIDTKVFHFVYLYVLWSVISITIRSALSSYTNNDVQYSNILKIFWEPTFTLWFLYALLIAFVAARLTRRISVPIQLVTAIIFGIIAHHLPEENNILVKTAKLYPLFIIGVHFSILIRFIVENKSLKINLITTTLYLICASLVFKYQIEFNSFLYYAMAILGAFSIMTAVKLLENVGPAFKLLNFIGQRSLYIYLMHFLPAAGTRVVLKKLGMIEPISITIIGTIISVISCIFVYQTINKFKISKFLFQKPKALSSTKF